MPKKRCLETGPDVRARLTALLARVQRIRRNCYPPGWTLDALFHIEQELASLLDDMRHG